MYGSRYLDFPNAPLYPFGYGLSYTSFTVSDVKVSAAQMRAGEALSASAVVTNVGEREGETVVQLYLRDEFASLVRPVKELKGYDKVTIKRGATHHFVVAIPYSNLECYDIATRRMVRAAQGIEDLRIYVGASSADIRLTRE
jgi:beta-glucosidase